MSWVAFLKGDNLVAYSYLSTSNNWPDKRGGLCWEGLYGDYSIFILGKS